MEQKALKILYLKSASFDTKFDPKTSLFSSLAKEAKIIKYVYDQFSIIIGGSVDEQNLLLLLLLLLLLFQESAVILKF